MSELSDKFGVPSLLILTVAIIISFGEYESLLYKEVSGLADLYGPNPEIRGNKVTEHEEWELVYRKLDLLYNKDTSNPLKDLSLDQLKQYLMNPR